MSDINYKDLDPGIREVVKYLHELGYDTTDSGDGVSKPDMACAIDQPHVVCKLRSPQSLEWQAKTLQEWLRRKYEDLEWHVQASYDTKDGAAMLFAYLPKENE